MDAASAPLPPGWEMQRTEDGRGFYVDHNRQTTQWSPPGPSAPEPRGFMLVSIGSLPFVKLWVVVTKGRLSFSMQGLQDKTSKTIGEVLLRPAPFLRLEEVARPHHIVVVPPTGPGGLSFPNLRLEPINGSDTERAEWHRALCDSIAVNESPPRVFEIPSSSALVFGPSAEGPEKVYDIKGKWWDYEQGKITTDGDQTIAFRMEMRKVKMIGGAPFKRIRIVKADQTEHRICWAREDLLHPAVAYRVMQNPDPTYLPHWKQIHMKRHRGSRCVALVSKPFIKTDKCLAEIRFARAMGVFAQSADIVVRKAENDSFVLEWLPDKSILSKVGVHRKGRYTVTIMKDCPIPHFIMLMFVALVDKLLNEKAATYSVHSSFEKTRANKFLEVANSWVGQKVVKSVLG